MSVDRPEAVGHGRRLGPSQCRLARSTPPALPTPASTALALTFALTLLAIGGGARGAAFDRLFVFGDSLSDSGRVHEATDGSIFTANARPDTPWYQPGRFTNGPALDHTDEGELKIAPTAFDRLWHERLADELNLPRAEAVPISDPPLATQTNYAVGGAASGTGHGGFVGWLLDLPHIGEQVDDFLAQHRAQNRAVTDRTLFAVWGGGNDLLDAVDDELDNLFSITPDRVRDAARRAVGDLKDAIDRLARPEALGGVDAQHVLWPNLPPLHLTPRINFLDEFDGRRWSDAQYDALRRAVRDASALIFNQEMDLAIQTLESAHPGLNIRKLDVLELSEDVLERPSEFGITRTERAAIRYDSFSSISFSAESRRPGEWIEPDQYMFWDQIHPTAAVHEILGRAAAEQMLGPTIPSPTAAVSLLLLALMQHARPRRNRPCGGRSCARSSAQATSSRSDFGRSESPRATRRRRWARWPTSRRPTRLAFAWSARSRRGGRAGRRPRPPRRGLILFFCLMLPAWLAVGLPAASLAGADSSGLDRDRPVERIAFGSCAVQRRPIPILETVLDRDPDLFLMLGDNVYADLDRGSRRITSRDVALAYAQLARRERFDALRRAVPILATWDDHDYGLNDAGRELPFKAVSQSMMLQFFREPADSPRWDRPGVYRAWRLGPEGRRLQIILLDTRYFRDRLDRRPGGPTKTLGPYRPTDEESRTLLGEAQWRWLEARLREPADVRLIASSIQVVAFEHGWESWGAIPHERHRLYELIRRTAAEGVFFLSGDRHLIEISRDATASAPYPMWDFTSSGLNERGERKIDEPNRFRVGLSLRRANFGLVHIDWPDPAEGVAPTITFEGVGGDGRTLMRETVEAGAWRFESDATPD